MVTFVKAWQNCPLSIVNSVEMTGFHREKCTTMVNVTEPLEKEA